MSAASTPGAETGWYRGNIYALVPGGHEGFFFLRRQLAAVMLAMKGVSMSNPIKEIRAEAQAALSEARDGEALAAWRSKFLGRRGAVGKLFGQIGALPQAERAAFGQQVNALQTELGNAYNERDALIQSHDLARNLEEGDIDISLPAYPRRRGGLHPSTRTHREFQAIWADMGFHVYQSRDVEEDEFNFTLLNLPPHHPARDMQDTFYTKDSRMLLRTHTSPGQIRAMRDLGESGAKPIRVILPGMCYRQEQVTARSEIQFHPGRRLGHWAQHPHERPKRHNRRIRQAHVQPQRQGALPRLVFPLHRAEYGSGCGVFPLQRRRLPRLQV